MPWWQATTRLQRALLVVAVLFIFGLAELVFGLITGLTAPVAVGGGVMVGALIFYVLAVALIRRRRTAPLDRAVTRRYGWLSPSRFAACAPSGMGLSPSAQHPWIDSRVTGRALYPSL